jgi:hypothetical protein
MNIGRRLLRSFRITAVAVPVLAGIVWAILHVIYTVQATSCANTAFVFPVGGVAFRLVFLLPLAASLTAGWNRPRSLVDIWRFCVLILFGFVTFTMACAFYIPPRDWMCAEMPLGIFTLIDRDLSIALGILCTVISALIAAYTIYSRRARTRREVQS